MAARVGGDQEDGWEHHVGQRLFDLWVRADMLLVLARTDTYRAIFAGDTGWECEVVALMAAIAQVDIGNAAARDRAIPIAGELAGQFARIGRSLDEMLVSFSGILPDGHSVGDLREQLAAIIT